MADRFLLPNDPRLTPAMLWPAFRAGNRLDFDSCQTHHLFWARNAIYQGLRALHLQPGENVLVPAYHCTSVVEPILQYGAAVKFYDIRLDLRPDFENLEKSIDGKTRAVLAIHYFGFPQPILKIKEFCRERGLFLIEDCAHVLTGQSLEGIPLGSSGDISIFSWRKFLPVYDGGQLVINNPALKIDAHWKNGSRLFSLKIVKNVFDKLMEDARNPILRRVPGLSHAPTALLRRFAANGYASTMESVNNYDLNFDLASADLRMSWLSRYIVGNTDISEVGQKRRQNYNILAAGISSLAGIRAFYPSLPPNVVPWVFPLLSYGIEKLHLKLRKRGVPAVNWSGVIHRSLPLADYPDSRFLYDNLVFLPLHQSLNEGHLQMVVNVLETVTKKKYKNDAKSLDGRLSLSAVSGR